ncbi:hypothetical protein GRJ2_000154600 [Grus japonensis]|uniref:Uncharacterized protein n=1 Tax=Grus japonensis TaxID=30415 RepID=A0ABC9VU07_GRUJA
MACHGLKRNFRVHHPRRVLFGSRLTWTQADLSRTPGQTKHNQPEEDAISAPDVSLHAVVAQRTGHFGK